MVSLWGNIKDMIMYHKIREKLEQSLKPKHLEIIDESYKHEGHAGAREGGETHFAVTIVSSQFAGLSRLARHKLVQEILKEEMASRIHALSITARTPGETS